VQTAEILDGENVKTILAIGFTSFALFAAVLISILLFGGAAGW